EDGIRDKLVTGVQTCALPISSTTAPAHMAHGSRVTYSTQSSSRHDRSAWAACVIAIISAWAVGSLSASRWLCAWAIMPWRSETRSEERRVGKEWRAGRWGYDE